MTRNAMGGDLTFRKALADRLELIKPRRQQIETILSIPGLIRLTDGMKELVDELKARNIDVYLVSGGFHELIDPIAKMLDIPLSNVYANRLVYFFDGHYAGFDHSRPTSESGGKPRVIKKLKKLSESRHDRRWHDRHGMPKTQRTCGCVHRLRWQRNAAQSQAKRGLVRR